MQIGGSKGRWHPEGSPRVAARFRVSHLSAYSISLWDPVAKRLLVRCAIVRVQRLLTYPRVSVRPSLQNNL